MRRPLLLVAIAITSCRDTFGEDERDWDEGTAESQAPGLTAFSMAQKHNLAAINRYRAKASFVALRISATLSKFAEAGSVQLAHDRRPHGHFIDAGTSKWQRGFRGMAAENQGDAWPELSTAAEANQRQQIDVMLQAMFDEGPGEGPEHGHYENMMNPRFRRVGIGVFMVGGVMYLTNDFSE